MNWRIFKMAKKNKEGDFLRKINSKSKQFFLGPGSTESFMSVSPLELEKSSERWRTIAKNLEDMSVGQYCMVAGTSIEGDSNSKIVENYRDRLGESIENVRKENKPFRDPRKDYELTILHEDNYHRLKVTRRG